MKRCNRNWLILSVVLVAGGFWFWDGYLEDRFVPKRFGVVEDGQIYRSGKLHPALLPEVLTSHQIRCIIDLRGEKPGLAQQTEEIRIADELGIEWAGYTLKGDGTGSVTNYAAAIARLHRAVQAGEPVLVHCAAGSQRTGGVIAAYRLLVQGRAVDPTIEEMMAYDWDPEKDAVMVRYLNDHWAELAALLVDQGVISSIPSPLPSLPSAH